MGRRSRQIIAIVAAIAIPYIAPQIASSIGLSNVIGTAAANTVTGAVLGATTSAATGGNPLIGAVTGGAGGYFGGGGGDLFAGPGPTPVAGPAGYGSFTTGADTGFTYYGGGTPLDTSGALTPFTPTAVPGQITGLDTYVNPSVSAPAPSASFVPTATPLDMGDISQGISYYGMEPTSFTPAPNVGLTPPTTTIADLTPQQADLFRGSSPTTTTAGGYTFDAMGNVVPAGGEAGPAIPGITPSSSVVSAPGSIPATAAPSTFTEALKKVPGEIAAKFKDPKALANLTLQAAGLIAGSLIAGDGMTPEERQLLEAERADLERLRTENEALFRERLTAAQNLLGDSRYFDPEYFGLQSARRSQLAGARSRKAGLRGLRGRQRDVAARQFDIETAKTTGTAYDVGAQTGLTGRLQTQQAGLSMMPTSFPSVNYGGLRGAYEAADARRRRTAGDVADLFGSFTGRSQAGSLG